MKDIKLSVGCNFDPELLYLKPYEFYGSVPELTPFGSARPDFRNNVGVFTGTAFMKRCADSGSLFNYTVNTPMIDLRSVDIKECEDMITELVPYVDSFTVAHPLVGELISKWCHTPIMASTIMRIRDARQIELLKRRIPTLNRVCIDVFANRDFKAIGEMASTGIDLEVIVNEFCVFDCIDRTQCYDLHALNMDEKDTHLFNRYPMGRCMAIRSINEMEWLMTRFILPEWIDYYSVMGIKYFKITGRTHPTRFIKFVTRAYQEGKSPENLLDLWGHLENIGRKEEDYKDPIIYIPTDRIKTMIYDYPLMSSYEQERKIVSSYASTTKKRNSQA